MAKSAIYEVIAELNKFLKANMPSIKATYGDWPNPNEKLILPCLSTFAKAPQYTPMMPYVKSKGDEIVAGADAGKVPVVMVKGMYDFRLQIDLWAESKPKRGEIEAEFIAAFNKNDNVTGISLQLVNYFDEWVRYDIESLNYPDSEAGSQRGEWRTQINVLANCKDLIEKNLHIIETIENNLETPDEIDAPESIDDGGSII